MLLRARAGSGWAARLGGAGGRPSAGSAAPRAACRASSTQLVTARVPSSRLNPISEASITRRADRGDGLLGGQQPVRGPGLAADLAGDPAEDHRDERQRQGEQDQPEREAQPDDPVPEEQGQQEPDAAEGEADQDHEAQPDAGQHRRGVVARAEPGGPARRSAPAPPGLPPNLVGWHRADRAELGEAEALQRR